MVRLDRTIAHPTPVAWIAGTILGRVPRTRRSARAASHPSTVMVRLDRTIARRTQVVRSENTRIRVYCATHSVVALTSR